LQGQPDMVDKVATQLKKEGIEPLEVKRDEKNNRSGKN